MVRESIYRKMESRIEQEKEGTIFLTKDFSDLAGAATTRKYIERLTKAGILQKIMDGIYEKPEYSRFLKKNLPPDPDSIASAIARNYHWTIAPSGDIALNRLGLSTQVPAEWSYISDGPYRKYQWNGMTISFKHRTNREISNMSETTVLVIEALKTLGEDQITEDMIDILKNKLPRSEKERLMRESQNASDWIHETIRKVCV